MDGIHDMGGMHGFGAIPVNKDDIFQHDWQRRAFSLCEALAPVVPFNTDQHRYAIERIAPVDYLRQDYFENWITAAETLLIEAGLVTQAELDAGKKLFEIDSIQHKAISPAELVAAARAGGQVQYPSDSQPSQFTVGQSVRVLNNHPESHTRVPRYVRGKLGMVVRDSGVFQFADTVAAGKGKYPQHCYTVSFRSELLWGNDAEANGTVYVDLWEAYLEPA